MKQFVTGGRTWILPNPELDDRPFTSAAATPAPHNTNASVLPPPTPAPTPSKMAEFSSFMKSFMTGMGILYLMFGIAFLLATLGVLIANLLFTVPVLTLTSEGGIIIPPNDPLRFTTNTLAIIILTPTAINLIMAWIERKTKFLNGKNENRNLGICVSAMAIIFFTASIVIGNDVNLYTQESKHLGVLKEWMNDRYGFEAYRITELSPILNGDHMYSADPQFPAHDVYLKESNGGYLLFDSTGKELPVKN